MMADLLASRLGLDVGKNGKGCWRGGLGYRSADALCLSLAFFSELVVAPIWAVQMDIAPQYAGTASGMMNFGFGIASILSPLVFVAALDLTGSWSIPFCGSLALILAGNGLSFFMHPEEPFQTEGPS